MTVYFGRPGSLVALRSPRRGISAKITRMSRVKETLSGGRAADYSPGTLREWQLAWPVLSHDDQSTLLSYFAGHNGVGPWVLLDGAQRNLLTANQSSATSTYNDTSGFTLTSGTETLASVTTPVERGPRALSWTTPAVVPSGVLSLSASRSDWAGIPVVPGQSYRFAFRVQGGGTDTAINIRAALRWLDSAGANLGAADNGSYVTTAAGSWATVEVTATCPAGGVYLIPRGVIDGTTVSAITTAYLDKFMLSMPTTRDPGTVWVAGLGVPRVTLPTFDHALSWINYHQVGLTISEVS